MEDHHHSVRAYVREINGRWIAAVGLSALTLAVLVLVWMAAQGWDRRYERVFEPLPGLIYAPPVEDVSLTTPDAPVPLTFQPLQADAAYQYNASIPVSGERLEPAAPFVLPPSLPALDRARALNCLAQAVYYEAASEGPQGQRAVAQVVLNRMRHPAFPSSVCGVVYSGSQRATGCQFTFTCDGSLARPPSPAAFTRARQVAAAALSGAVEPSVGQATHYHTLYVAPYWSPSLLKLANIGAHTFYRWKGANGKRSAFISAYAGQEPTVSGRMTPFEQDDLLTDDIVAPPVTTADAAAPADLTPQAPLVVAAPPRPVIAPAIAPPAAAAPAATAAPAPAKAAPATPAPDPEQAERPRRRIARADW